MAETSKIAEMTCTTKTTAAAQTAETAETAQATETAEKAKKPDWTAIIVFAAIAVLFMMLLITLAHQASTISSTTDPDPDTEARIAEARATGDRYTLMLYADGTENFPMDVEKEIGDEYIRRIEFQYSEPLDDGKHYVRTIFYLGEEEEKYGGYGDLWVNSEYDGEQNPLLRPEVADYDPLEDLGLSLSDLFAQARTDVSGLPNGIFYGADYPDSIGVKTSYDQNTIIYFYTEQKGKAAAVMFDWSTNLTHAAFYD